MYINEEAAIIFKLCNGKNSDQELISILMRKYNDTYDNVSRFVLPFLEQCNKTKILDRSEIKFEESREIIEYGSSEYWFPQHIIIELTHNCSLFCKHCYVDAGVGKSMDDKILLKLVDDIINSNCSTVQLTGGEPTNHPKFPVVLEKLIKNGIIVTVTTNGYFSDNVINSFLPMIGSAGYVSISIDGMEDYHNKIRGRKDAYKKTITSIKKLSDLGIKVRVATCLIDQSYEDIVELVKIIKEIGANTYSVAGLDYMGRAELNALSTFYNTEKIKNLINNLKINFEDDNFKINDESVCEYNQDSLFKNCGAGYNLIKISPNGEVNDCIKSKKIIGKLDENHNLITVLKDNLTRMINKSQIFAPNKNVCGDCEDLPYCENCIANANLRKCKKYNF